MGSCQKEGHWGMRLPCTLWAKLILNWKVGRDGFEKLGMSGYPPHTFNIKDFCFSNRRSLRSLIKVKGERLQEELQAMQREEGQFLSAN